MLWRMRGAPGQESIVSPMWQIGGHSSIRCGSTLPQASAGHGVVAIKGVEPRRPVSTRFVDREALDAARVVYAGMSMSPTWIGARAAGLTSILVDRGDRLPYADCLRGRSFLDLTPPPANIWHDKPP
jgi:hypothetical protein